MDVQIWLTVSYFKRMVKGRNLLFNRSTSFQPPSFSHKHLYDCSFTCSRSISLSTPLISPSLPPSHCLFSNPLLSDEEQAKSKSMPQN